jgi:HSP20 family protein
MLTESRPQFRFPDHRDWRERRSGADRWFWPLALQIDFPPVNIWSSADGAIVTAEIPGVSPDTLDITVQALTVTLRGRREPEAAGEGVVAHREERPHGDFVRVIILPFRVDAEKVSAHFERGILRLELPRPEQDKPRKVKVA